MSKTLEITVRQVSNGFIVDAESVPMENYGHIRQEGLRTTAVAADIEAVERLVQRAVTQFSLNAQEPQNGEVVVQNGNGALQDRPNRIVMAQNPVYANGAGQAGQARG